MQKRPSIARQDERESSRIESETGHGDRDVQGYRAVAAFIQRGLGDQMEIVRQVLDIAAKVQNDNNLNFPVALFSFGWDDGILHGKGRARSGGPNIPCNGWATELCDMASAETSPVPQKTPSLFPPAKQTGAPLKVKEEDLLIFFCKDRSMRLTDEAMARYDKPLKHAVWIYCEDDKLEMAFGIKESIMITENKPAVEIETITEQEMKLSKSSVQRKSGALTCTSKSCRGLSPDFMTDLEKGTLKNLLAVVKADDTLSLNIRDGYVNIYYRGGSLVKISERKGYAGQYEFLFNGNYMRPELAQSLGLPVPKINTQKKSIVPTQMPVELWVSDIPALKCSMDLYFSSTKQSLEREFQQLVERMNNNNPSTDYFICDIEYTNTICTELRADLIALHWPSISAVRKCLDCGRLAIFEMKHNDDALSGKSGVVEHIKKMDRAFTDLPNFFENFCEEMKATFNQRVKLGLIQCHEDPNKQPIIQAIKSDKVDYILLLSDHDPNSEKLSNELRKLQSYLQEMPSHFNIKVALSTFMGYGLYDESIYTLDDFLSRFGKQIGPLKKKVT